MGTYTPEGKVFIDKVAWDNLDVGERNAVVRHEKREWRLRMDGAPYETAHRRALREERGYTPSLEDKLRDELSRFGERKHVYPPPKNVMGGFLPTVEFARSYARGRNIGLDGRSPEDRASLPTGYSHHVLTKGKTCTNKKSCGLVYFFGDTVFRSPTGRFYCPQCGGELK